MQSIHSFNVFMLYRHEELIIIKVTQLVVLGPLNNFDNQQFLVVLLLNLPFHITGYFIHALQLYHTFLSR